MIIIYSVKGSADLMLLLQQLIDGISMKLPIQVDCWLILLIDTALFLAGCVVGNHGGSAAEIVI